MRKFILMLLVAVSLLSGLSFAQGAETPKTSVRIWLIFDGYLQTWSDWDQIRAVGRAAVRSLAKGDRVRIVSAAGDNPRVLLLEQISDDETIREEALQTIEELRRGSPPNSDLAKALAVPLAALEKAEAGKSSTDLVLVITNGKLGDNAAKRLLEVHDKLVALGVPVVVTGVRDSNTNLLVAAARGRLAWRELSIFDPSAWIAENRKISKPAPTAAPQPEAPKTPLPALPAPAVGAPSPGPTTPASPSPSSHTPGEDGFAPGKKVLEFNISVTTPSEGKTGTPGSSQMEPATAPGTNTPGQSAPVSPAPSSGPSPSSGPTTPATLPATKGPGSAASEPSPETPPSAETTPNVPIPSGKKLWTRWYVWGPLLLLGLVVVVLLALVMTAARGDAKQSAPGAEPKARPCQVVARSNGTERILGSPQSLLQFNVGSGAQNTLRIQEDGIEEQHLHARRGRGGVYQVTNLASTPVEVNGATIGPGKTTSLEFPAMVRLGKKSSFSLSLRPLKGPQDTSSLGGDAAGSGNNG